MTRTEVIQRINKGDQKSLVLDLDARVICDLNEPDYVVYQRVDLREWLLTSVLGTRLEAAKVSRRKMMLAD